MRETFRYPEYRRFFTGRVVNALGGAIAPIALTFAILRTSPDAASRTGGGSALLIGLVLGAQEVAGIAVSLLAGVLADRLPRRRILVLANLVLTVAQGTVAALFLTGTPGPATLIPLSLAIGAGLSFSFPAMAAMAGQVVPADARQSANATIRIGTNIAAIAGASIGALVMSVTGPAWAWSSPPRPSGTSPVEGSRSGGGRNARC